MGIPPPPDGIIPKVTARLCLIALVLLHALTTPTLRAGGQAALMACARPGSAQAMPCATDHEPCCCAALPADNTPEPEPITGQPRATELAPPAPALITPWDNPETPLLASPAPTARPGTDPIHRRLARICVWRT